MISDRGCENITPFNPAVKDRIIKTGINIAPERKSESAAAVPVFLML